MERRYNMDVNAITAVSSPLSQSSLSLKVGVAVTKLAMDSATESSQALVSMMERSVNPGIGGNIDVRV